MKTKILSLGLCSAVLASCGLSLEIAQPGDVAGRIVLPETIKSQSVAPIKLADARAVPGEYLVRFAAGVGAQSITSQGIRVEPLQINNANWALVKASSLSEVKALPGVEFAQPNYIYDRLRIVPNDPYAAPGNLNNQWYLYQDLNGIGADNGWEHKNEFKSVIKVAVIDDGYTPHTDMPQNMFDVTDPGCDLNTGARCLDAINKKPNPQYQVGPGDETSHGMAVAGIIAAQMNNGLGIAGIGFNALRVVPIKVFAPGAGTTSAVLARAINTAVSAEVRVINLSLCLTDDVGGGRIACYNPANTTPDAVINDAIQNAVNNNITVVASAGNYNDPWVGYPASNPNVISVGATDSNKKRMTLNVSGQIFGSNYGPGLDMVAPGKNIRTLSILNNTAASTYRLENGTSFSAPMVSAAAGLLYSKDNTLTQGEVRNILISTGEKPADPSIDNARFLRVDLALATNPKKLQGKVRLVQGNTTVKATDLTNFASNGSTLPFNLQDVPGGNYMIIAEVSSDGNLLYKCSSGIRVSGNVTRDLNVHYAGGNLPCF